MSIFGWSLPPGCTTLPGEEDEQLNNQYFAEAFPEADGPGELYRQLYKYTDCGPSLGISFNYIEVIPCDGITDYPSEMERSKTLYCDELYKLGTWKDMDERGELVTTFYVSSIVEGVDYNTDTIEVEAKQLYEEAEDFAKRLHSAVEQVKDEANQIWQDTHGCETCEDHWRKECGATNFDEGLPVWKDCPDCEGNGTII